MKRLILAALIQLVFCVSPTLAQETPDSYGADPGPPERDLGFRIAHTRHITDSALSPNSRILATASADHTARLWDTASGRLLNNLIGHSGEVDLVAFSPNGKLLATSCQDKTVRVWSVSNGRLLQTLPQGSIGPVALAFTSDSSKLAIADIKGPISIWVWRIGKTDAQINRALRSYDLRFSPDGGVLLSA